jgi:hypothetical protein
VPTKRPRRRFTCRGKTLTIAEWSRLKGIPHSTLTARLNRGWTISRSLTTPWRDKPAPGRGVLPAVVGKVFCDLTVLRTAPNRSGSVKRVWCRCVCGAELEVDVIRLVRENQRGCSKSAECLRKRGQRQWSKRDSLIAQVRAANLVQEHLVWCRLRTKAKRGTKVHQAWLEDFWVFIDDVGPKPEPNYWFARQSKDGGWNPANAAWMPPNSAVKNRRPYRKVKRKRLTD